MARRRDFNNDMRFLLRRNNSYHYHRRVPDQVAKLDARYPVIRFSLKTNDEGLAKLKRNDYEQADDAYWAELLSGQDGAIAHDHYVAAVKRADAKGFLYRPSWSIISSEPYHQIMRRLEAVNDPQTPVTIVKAVLGHEEPPAVKVSDAFKLYINEICREEAKGKSPNQYKRWFQPIDRAQRNFTLACGDIAMTAITKEHANRFKKFWLDRVLPEEEGGRVYKGNSANREIGDMRQFYEAYFNYLGETERRNPFEKMRFSEDDEEQRPPYSIEWIRDVLLRPGAMATLNDEARGITLAMIETGARPSELGSLEPEHIRLDHAVPHVFITPTAKRQIKTASSKRMLPLVGVALAVFQKHPKGFPRYYDNNASWSATVNSYFEDNNLVPPPHPDFTLPHTAYSLRHSFKDRMERAGFSEELKLTMMGHSFDKPKYGEVGGLPWHREQLLKLALPFDPSIV